MAVQAPTAEEQLAILGRAFPQLSALLPAGMAALSLVKAAAGQSWDTTEVSSYPHTWSYLTPLLVDRSLQGQGQQTPSSSPRAFWQRLQYTWPLSICLCQKAGK